MIEILNGKCESLITDSSRDTKVKPSPLRFKNEIKIPKACILEVRKRVWRNPDIKLKMNNENYMVFDIRFLNPS